MTKRYYFLECSKNSIAPLSAVAEETAAWAAMKYDRCLVPEDKLPDIITVITAYAANIRLLMPGCKRPSISCGPNNDGSAIYLHIDAWAAIGKQVMKFC